MSNVNNNVQGQAARTLTGHALAATKYLPAAFLRQLGLHDLSNGRGLLRRPRRTAPRQAPQRAGKPLAALRVAQP